MPACAPTLRTKSPPWSRRTGKRSSRLGVRFGTESVYFEPLLRADTMRFRALLWAVRHGRPVPTLPSARRLAKPIEIDPELPPSFYAAIGFRVLDGFALRPDRLERLAAAAQTPRAQRPLCTLGPNLRRLRASNLPALRGLLAALGYRAVIGGRSRKPSCASRGDGVQRDKGHRAAQRRRAKVIPLPNCGS